MAFLLKPPDMQESPKERASAFGQRLPSKHWIKSASRQSPIEKGHCTKHVIMQGFFWYFLFQTCPAKTLYRYKQSAQRLMILMRMSLAKPESLAHVPWFCALHAWEVRLPCKSHQWSNGTDIYSTWMAWVGPCHPPWDPAPFQPAARNARTWYFSTNSSYRIPNDELMFWQADSVLCFFPWKWSEPIPREILGCKITVKTIQDFIQVSGSF